MNSINKFEEKVKRYVISKNMFDKDDKVVLGVSGGADSICLFNILLKLNIDFVVVHVNHCIRGEEADADEQFVVDNCIKHDIPYVVIRKKIKEYANEKRLTEEEAGRIVRYEAFDQVMKEYGAKKIAVAHNMNDNAETVLFNLFRGSGMAGMCGIKSVNKNIVRPLMCVSRSEIEEYLDNRDIKFKDDRTNFLEEYTRNKIRLKILPYVEENINVKAIKHMSDLSDIALQTEEFLNDYTMKLYKNIVSIDNDIYKIDIEGLLLEKKIIQKKLIRYVLNCIISRLKDIEAVHVDDIVALCDKQVSRKVSLPYNLVASRNYKTIDICVKKEESVVSIFHEVDVNNEYYIEYLDAYLSFELKKYDKNQNIIKDVYTKWFDYDKIDNIIKIRNRQPGDYIQLNVNGGKKKLKEYFIDEKINKAERDSVPLLTDGSHVLWILGKRSSEGYLVDDNTKNVLEVCLKKREKENDG